MTQWAKVGKTERLVKNFNLTHTLLHNEQVKVEVCCVTWPLGALTDVQGTSTIWLGRHNALRSTGKTQIKLRLFGYSADSHQATCSYRDKMWYRKQKTAISCQFDYGISKTVYNKLRLGEFLKMALESSARFIIWRFGLVLLVAWSGGLGLCHMTYKHKHNLAGTSKHCKYGRQSVNTK